MKRAVKLRAIVFDLDGTLIDSIPLVLRSIAHALEPFGVLSPQEIFAKLGGPPERFLPTLLKDVRHAPVARERLDAFHRANEHLIQTFDGVLLRLERLRAAGVQLAIWTGRDRESADQLLGGLKLDGLFATIVCGDDLRTHKPDPEGLLEVMRRLGVAANEMVFVGDADVDVLGGVACGVDTVLIEHGREIDPHLRAKAWHTVDSPIAALDFLLSE